MKIQEETGRIYEEQQIPRHDFVTTLKRLVAWFSTPPVWKPNPTFQPYVEKNHQRFDFRFTFRCQEETILSLITACDV